ncbi:hypothetical protein AA313_de0203672 [Arthrobotrys entomopaga]|nr:hypothetical protein AA313_de0203672 [Arthrobotrys entomopaga]
MQNYNPKIWAKVTFEFTYSQVHLYHTIIALALSHRRFLRGQTERATQEVSHYMKALASFRSLISNPQNILTLNQLSWIGLLVTSATLTMYIMSAPIGTYEITCDTYFSLSRGTLNMLVEAIKRGAHVMPSSHGSLQKRITPVPASEESLAWDFPGLYHASSGEDKAISRTNAQKLATILTSLPTSDRSSMDAAKSLALLRPILEWASQSDASLIQQFRLKNNKTYLVMAHYFAALWKVKELMEELSNKGLWQEETGTVDMFWWLKSPKDLCKRSIELLEGEPIERVSWVKEVIKELESG